MHKRLTVLVMSLLAIAMASATAQAQTQADPDTVFEPKVVFSGIPKVYEIADIKVTGADNYEDFTIIGYSGLKVGERLEIPGNELTAASKRLWRQGLFSNVQVVVDKVVGDKAWITLALRQQPRISKINYFGVKKGERTDLEERLQLYPGNQITQNIINRAEAIIKHYFSEKGFGSAEVNIVLHEDLSKPNEVIVDINVDKKGKIKVHKIYVGGNEVLSDDDVRTAMKKTRSSGTTWRSFWHGFLRGHKYVEQDYKDDLNRIIDRYNEKGYRDAQIVLDSVVPYGENKVDIYIDVVEGDKYYIDDITWVGNTVFSTDMLNQILGMKPGDVYNQVLLERRLGQRQEGKKEDDIDIPSIYQNRGYLFYNLVPIERNIHGDSVSLELRMSEGPQARINNIVIKGNDRLYEKVIRRELRIRPGELFSKDDLMRSAREIAQTGHFNPETMDIQPQPNPDDGTVDILFGLESKANDQVELSFGWGQTGIIGKVALKFNNFSIKNLLYPSTYRGLIPQGEGQQFSIAAQTNARYYQSYSISFLDPWFGGKRPNSLSLSAYYSRQTGVNSSFYNSQWRSGLGGYYGYGSSFYNYGNYNYNDYYSNAIQNAYDPNKFIQIVSVAVGFGKRLSWPDDYFTLQAQLMYNLYYLKNWDYTYYMQNGASNALVLGLTLSRNSIDNPLYTRRGSTFSLDFQFTPPASLFGKKDWKKLSEESTTSSKKQLYRWIEYWKLRFKSRTYTPLTSPEGKYTLVLMTRADFGLLGSYNKYLKSPFETFYVGGDGMSGSYSYATETIALRGYDNGSLTPWRADGYAYTRFGAELHFPFMLQTSTTIYGLAFVEGGNAWTSVKDFSPFNLKRSAGAGVRVFLPMVGMMGIDWAYGFDKVYGERGGSHFHFILGQEF